MMSVRATRRPQESEGKNLMPRWLTGLISNVKNNPITPTGFKQACQEQLIAVGMSITSDIRRDLEICVMENKFTLRKMIGRSFTVIKKNFTMNNPLVWFLVTILSVIVVWLITILFRYWFPGQFGE